MAADGQADLAVGVEEPSFSACTHELTASRILGLGCCPVVEGRYRPAGGYDHPRGDDRAILSGTPDSANLGVVFTGWEHTAVEYGLVATGKEYDAGYLRTILTGADNRARSDSASTRGDGNTADTRAPSPPARSTRPATRAP